jgi:LysR family transcriptional regulator, benzoate and cis,cis-muconate-responsive activator of ben and cat genes
VSFVYSQQHSDVEVALRKMPPGEQLTALREGRLDLALIGNACPEVEREFAITTPTGIPLQAVLPGNHLLALRKRIALSELEGENFIGFANEKFPGRNAVICAACQAAGFTPQLRHYVEALSALLGPQSLK